MLNPILEKRRAEGHRGFHGQRGRVETNLVQGNVVGNESGRNLAGTRSDVKSKEQNLKKMRQIEKAGVHS